MCTHCVNLRHTHTHKQQAREAREAYADNILYADMNSCVASIAIDAADQAKHRCPLLSFTSRASAKVKKIIQQFVGVLDHRMGYSLFRRMPYVQKGANLTLTLLIELIRQGHLDKKSEMFIQWDGASENVAKTNLRFFVWFLLMCDSKGLPLQTITVCRLSRMHSHTHAHPHTCVHMHIRMLRHTQITHSQIACRTHPLRCGPTSFSSLTMYPWKEWSSRSRSHSIALVIGIQTGCPFSPQGFEILW